MDLCYNDRYEKNITYIYPLYPIDFAHRRLDYYPSATSVGITQADGADYRRRNCVGELITDLWYGDYHAAPHSFGMHRRGIRFFFGGSNLVTLGSQTALHPV